MTATISGSASGLTGDLTANDHSTVTLNTSDHADINGNITGSGSSNTTVNLNHSDLTGDVTVNDTATVTINGTNSHLTGDLTGNQSGTLTANLTGPGSVFTGDVTQNDTSTVTLNLDGGATGTGGFNGGHLNIDSDSSFHFDKDSHLDNTHNDGRIGVGDHQNYLTIDGGLITGSGSWTFPVDTDTGEHSKVTGTTAPGHHPTAIVDPIGSGKLDPDQVLADMVTGPGHGQWIWPDFDWGFDQYTKDGDNPDGTPHFKPTGNQSLASSVLGSANAVQQTMWFAQQNSLLKRMGDLRFNHENTLIISGKDAKAVTILSADRLIDNIWIRGYGQQLNLGGKVTGRAYEQLIYGTDIGTDHKFTLDAIDSDLYLGVFAGYGRSDLDFRAARTDGTLNSYYGGFYATWLHDSGLYADLTLKAASVDNNLKAPYGARQLTAKYNDVNIGGSLELGKKFTFAGDWFIEPQLQFNYLHILAEDYNAGPLNIAAQDLDAIQMRAGALFGKTIKFANGGALQPYLKASGVEMLSTGGKLRNGAQSVRANIDGARAEIGGGVIWQLDDRNQLHLDYEASFGDKYSKPWGLTAGYRHQF
ncbi:MAG: autotransporter domain-containing protein [Verrucomicrobiales bacterium]|nr:autotransporter domain-containing protein [Verrucomicrobiales bacterium]